MKQDPNMPDSDVTTEYMMENIWIVGSREEVAEKIGILNDTAGGFGVLLAMGHEWLPREAWLDSMGLLINEIIPRVD